MEIIRPAARPSIVRRLAIHAAALVALLAVFSLYTRPEFMVALSEQIWLCFQ